MKILVLEDNEPLARSFARTLRARGHEVDVVDSMRCAERALDDSGGYDVLLTDREVLDGDAWVWAVRRLETLPRVVFMTGNPPAHPPLFFLKGSPTHMLITMIEGGT